ncbi:MAG: hypothetical protein HRU19_24855 [Pseudobacteriovorax sp.]|nr:hypothetical protein [Pseudobacteriovorax sp.]
MIPIIKFLFLSLFLLNLSTLASAADFVITYDTNDVRRCFRADANGRAFGNSVNPSNCSSTVGTAYSANDTLECFYLDSRGRAFDYAINAARCATTYKVDYSADGGLFCFAADDRGRTFGNAVSVSYCSTGYYGISTSTENTRLCFAADERGRYFGYAVDSSLCSPFAIRGRACKTKEVDLCRKFEGGNACFEKWCI